MALVKPTLTFELGLTAGFHDATTSVAWTDITNYVISWSTGRGREPKRPPAHFDPGQADLLLNNRDRRFDPTNTAGPYYPNLQPARVRLRIRATWDAGAGPVTYDVITAFVKRWPPEWTATATSVVKITAVDAMGAPLNLAQIAGSIWQTMVRHDKPLAWYRLGEGSGTLAADSTPHRHDGQYQGSPELGKDSLVITDTADKAARFVTGSRLSIPDKNLIPGYPFTVESWFRCSTDISGARMILCAFDGPSAGWRQVVQIFISQAAFGAEAGKVIAFVGNPYPTTATQTNSTITVNDGAVHHLVVVFRSSTDIDIYIDGADRTFVWATNAHTFPNDLLTGYAIGNNPAASFGDFRFGVDAGDVLDEVVIYDYALSTTRIVKHYQGGAYFIGEASGSRVIRLLEEADWPTAVDVDVDPGESLLVMVTSAGGVVANLQKVEDSEQGAIFIDESGKLVFHDRHHILAAPYTVSQVTLEQGVGTLAYEPPVLWGNDDAELYNAATGSRVGGPVYTVVDETSQDAYGERPLPSMDGLLNLSDSEVVDLLTYRVSKYAQPTPTVRQVRLHPAAQPALYPYVLGLGLRSRITVKVAPPGGGPVFSQESHIERITHEVDATGDWWTTWDISAADTASYLTLDDPVRGLLDSGNLVAF